MKAAIYEVNGDPENLRIADIDDPVPGRHDVLIGVHAISIEGGDVLTRRRVPAQSGGDVVGYAGAGVVVAVGSGVVAISPGDRVAAFNWSGSHAELWSVPETFVYRVPFGLDLRIAATIPVAFGTAGDALFEFGGLLKDECVLVRGATGGVGIAAVQLAARNGSRVIATTSTNDLARQLTALGAEHVINYRSSDLTGETLALTDGRGVDLLIDLAGGSGLTDLISAVRYRGRISVVGASSGEPTTIEFGQLVSRSLSVFGISFGQEMHLPRAHRLVETYLEEAAAGLVKMPIERCYPLAEVGAAHRHAEFGHPFGRVIMTTF
ncbi:quinone oxidoreductase family protein [Mycolicibacterium fluoranthenivorans]|uniref:NADPH:quinone reductase n=1 Tax=Mycolicibacterium fluoranthenivorans TaxID=258505 RepID=A0A1G4WBI7_9MYCO|nr:zinc-binding dehydrogenase [Mycolicibacterium fluoranthenivorans]SCX19283.1 NADPH:quinone reductase [Mycolicibacterium fluoranthenivorans]